MSTLASGRELLLGLIVSGGEHVFDWLATASLLTTAPNIVFAPHAAFTVTGCALTFVAPWLKPDDIVFDPVSHLPLPTFGLIAGGGTDGRLAVATDLFAPHAFV